VSAVQGGGSGIGYQFLNPALVGDGATYGVMGLAAVDNPGNTGVTGTGPMGVAGTTYEEGQIYPDIPVHLGQIGVMGVASQGAGVAGRSTAGVGVYGTSHSLAPNAKAIHGVITQTSPGSGAAAVRGENLGTGSAGIGVWGSQLGSGWGVYGQSLSGVGVLGKGMSGATATGVKGLVGAGDDYVRGVHGAVDPPGGEQGYLSCGVYGENLGTGSEGHSSGVDGYHAGSGWGVYGHAPAGIGVYGVADATGPFNAGVWAKNENNQGAALVVDNGSIRVKDAGIGTPTAAFIHEATAENSSMPYTVINNVQCNGDPDALLFVTERLSLAINGRPVYVSYELTSQRWRIYNTILDAIPIGAKFNVLVIKP
jgi:hypothetical protein